MKLRSKFSILMIFAVAIPIIICVAITYFSIKNSITKIEIDNSKIKIQNTQNYINSLIKSQEDTLGSWLPWTEFFTHVKERDIELIKIDLGDPKENSPTEILGVLDKDYNPIYFSDTAPEEWTSMNFKDFDFVKGLKGSTHFFSNIETYKGETYLVGIAKITHDNDDEFKDFAGYLILARKINAGLLEKGKNILGIDFAIRFNSKTFSTKKDVKFLSNDIPKEIQAFSNVDSQKMTVVSEAGLEDSLGKHIGTIHVESISTQGVKALNLLLICFVVILIVMLICSMGITSVSIEALIIKPLNDIIKVTEDTSKGNLAVKVDYKSRNEIGKLSKCINIMIDSLRKILSKVVESSDKIASLSEELSSNSEENSKATEQISNSVQEMLQGAEKQSNKVIEASETISKLLNSIEDVSSNAQLASDLSIEALSYAQEGNKTVQTLEKEMNTINEEVSNSAVVVEELGDQSKEISKIIDIIKHIADQTNLLSLNAAIEAARAGEYGRSFAVVASEIRKLANQSEEFTKQIEEILNNIEKGASKAVESMKHGTEEVKKGTIIVNEAGMTFKKILLSVEKASNQIQEISGLIQGMAQDSKYISNSMNEVLDIANFQLENTQTVASTTEEQFASMEEIASSANILADMAQELRVLVENFKV